MLYVWEIQDRSKITEWLESLNISKQTWLLSDLRTKFEIQDFFIQRCGFFLEESVLRISDLWKKILLRSHPDFKVVSQQAVILHLRAFLRQHGEAIGLSESSENSLLKWMTDLAPVYFHPDGEEKIDEWFSQNSDQEESWRDWWLRAKVSFAYFESKKQLLPQWIPSFLQRISDLSLYWEKDLFVDLSSQLSYVESELLHQISRKNDVYIVSPTLSEKSQKYDDLLRPYEYLKGFASKVTKIEVATKNVTDTPNWRGKGFLAFSSSLGSIRQVTYQIRQWIEQGVPLDLIAVVAPDIETVWPVLSFHLDIEGIPFNKSVVSSYQSVIGVQNFLAKLRALNRNLSTRDLELTYYDSADQKPELSFERFEALYKNIYDEADYARFDKMKESLALDLDLKMPMTPSQFILQVATMSTVVAEDEIPKWLDLLVRDILGSFDEHFQMPWGDWVSFCESSLSRHEVLIAEASSKGIMVTNLMSGHFLKVTHRIFLEMSEENLKAKSERGILPQAARKLSKDLGFWLNHSEQGDAEFELEWALQCRRAEDQLFFGATNLAGQILTPSSVWLKERNRSETSAAHVHSAFQIPQRTVVDEVLNQSILSERLQQDLGEAAVKNIARPDIKFLSPSALEAFYKCPFTYYARQTLGLRTFPEIDLDVDRRSTGEALHFLFENILNRGLEHWDEKELSRLLEEVKSTHFTGVVEILWSSQKKKMIKLCQRFIQYEIDWRKRHSGLKQTRTEVNWQGQFQNVNFRGRIDRVDISDKQEMVVLDYKLSGSQLKGAHQWIENGSLQMLFYIYALEHGWAEGLEGEVVAAFYFVVKNFSRETGFELDHEIPNFFENTKKRNQKLSDEKKKLLIQSFEETVKSLTDRLKDGQINPVPSDENTCVTCEWRRLCRAPHLA
jgi:RecB family exonuclease